VDLETHPSIAVGDTLVVVEVLVITGGEPSFRVVHPGRLPEDRLPSIWPARMFEILDPSMPSTWELHVHAISTDKSFLKLAPQKWQRPGFWEDLMDGPLTERAISEYEQELTVILDEARAQPR
jgi:hypothetical protein